MSYRMASHGIAVASLHQRIADMDRSREEGRRPSCSQAFGLIMDSSPSSVNFFDPLGETHMDGPFPMGAFVRFKIQFLEGPN